MIAPDQDGTEVPQAVAIDVWAPDQRLFAALRSRPGGQAALLAVGDDVAIVAGEGLALDTDRARIEQDGLSLELDLGEAAPAATVNAPGLRRTAQLRDAAGRLARDRKQTSVRARAVQAITWSDPGAARRRAVTATSDDGALLHLVALRARAAAPHGDDLVLAEIAEPDGGGTTAFEEARLSTIYRADGLPRTAGAELYQPGEEWPARLSGEAVAGAVLDAAGTGIAVSFFRWVLRGRPAWGTYEIEPAP